MTKIDMKYTSLFWKLGFIEESTDQYHKVYSNVYRIDIEAEQQEIEYDFNTKLDYSPPTHLYEHKDFVVLECVNRLLEKGYSREDILIIGDASQYQIPDVIVIDKTGKNLIAFDCKQWGKSFDEEYLNFKSGQGILFSYFQAHSETAFLCLYTSRLDGGLLEYKNAIIPTSSIENNLGLYFAGIFEDEFTPFVPIVSFSEQERQESFKQMDKEATQIEDVQDYRIQEGVLLKYLGNKTDITLPPNIIHIGTGAFWNCISLVSVEIPNGVLTIGGDAFYKCYNLESVNIPASVIGIGNDPFAGCPLLTLSNDSSHFLMEDGVMYDKEKTFIIHYPINRPSSSFVIPEGVRYIEKHTFYDCNQITNITLPRSLICIENNAFSGLKNLTVINESPYFTIENGVLYNKEKTQLYSVYDHTLESLEIPNTVKTIGKNSFWDCSNLKKVIIPESVTRIGYNPFAGCTSLVLENYSPNYVLQDGILYNSDLTEFICCPNMSIIKTISIPDSVVKIGRNAFSCCTNLESLEIPSTVITIERGVFSGCSNLVFITIPKSVVSIGEWAFGYCEKLKSIRLPKTTKIEVNTFAQCDVKISYF